MLAPVVDASCTGVVDNFGLASLITAEKKKIARIAYAVPISEIQVGDQKGQIPVRQLQRTLMKMPRELKPVETLAAALALIVLSWAVFILGLGLTIPVWPEW